MIKEIYRDTLNEIITGQGITKCFRTSRGVRQGCTLSPTLFNVFIENMDLDWERRKKGGTVIGGQKIFGLKFADDLALVSDTPEGLRDLIKTTNKYIIKNKMEINVAKSKVMIFRKGGLNKMKKILYLMDTLVKAGGLYGVEIWGWARSEDVERMQGKFVKMAMGLARTTPGNIWRMESGRHSLETETVMRAGKYLFEILRMDSHRWPKICLREEIRGLINNNPTKWGKTLKKAFSDVGDGETISMIWFEEKSEIISNNLTTLVKKKIDRELQGDWGWIDKSSYCKYYKEIKKQIGREEYWDNENIDEGMKEEWARLRCGNLGKVGKKGYKDEKCRMCKKELEDLGHIFVCDEVNGIISDNLILGVKKWIGEREGQNLDNFLLDSLTKLPNPIVCAYAKNFKRKIHEKQ